MTLFSLKRAVPSSPAGHPGTLPELSCHEQPCHENIPYEQYLAEQIHCRLLDLDFPAFALCLCRLLHILGYQDVHLAGRREWKGYNKPGGGGYDLEATLPGSLLPGSPSTRRVVVQIKQFDGLRVHQRNVDELRGTCLRVGAAEALLITTSAFSKVARAGAAAPGGAGSLFAPVRLMDGEELIALMIRHHLGVKEHEIKPRDEIKACDEIKARKMFSAGNLAGKKKRYKQWEIDDTFFAELALASAILSKEAPTKRQRPLTPPNSTPMQCTTSRKNLMQWRVTVRISSNPEGKKKEVNQKEVDQKGGG